MSRSCSDESPDRSYTTQTPTAMPRKPPGRSYTTQTPTATPRKPPARSQTIQTPTATPRKPPARSAAGPRCALQSLASLAPCSAYVVRARRASRPLSFPPCRLSGAAHPWRLDRKRIPGSWTGSAPRRAPDSHALPSRFARSRLAALTHSSLARAFLARAPRHWLEEAGLNACRRVL